MDFDLSLAVNNRCDHDLDDELKQLLHRLAEEALRAEGMPKGVEIGLTLVDDREIAHLNEQYRGVNSTTDVLSFPMFAADELDRLRDDPSLYPERPLLVGDVVISVPTALRQADEYGHGYRRELAFLFLHGLLHLLGYDHDDELGRTKMRAAEKMLLSAAGVARRREKT